MMDAGTLKDSIFEYIKKSDTVGSLVSQKRFDEAARTIVRGCYDTISETDESAGVAATAILHYLLTVSLVPSQRKVGFGGEELDIVVPDTKTLEQDPKRALVILIAKSSDPGTISEAISGMERVQPVKENIWTVLPREVDTGKRSFVLDGNGGSFAGMIFEIARFANQSGTGRFRILRV